MGWRLTDLPEPLRKRVEAQLAAGDAGKRAGCKDASPRAQITASPIHCPNRTEAEYRDVKLKGTDARYEALTFRLVSGHKYTPDWVVFENGTPVECHEVKGAYRFGSHQRARLAFDQAAVEFPGVRWVWAVKSGDGWRIEAKGGHG